MDTVTAAVARQYTEHVYPPPLEDLAVSADHRAADVTDPGVYPELFWPEAPRTEDLDILVAGCGAIQAAVLAYNNPSCRVLGVDLSLASLQHHAYLRERHALSNLELVHGDLRQIGERQRDFDLVVSTGVLHHLADPDEGLKALRAVMRPKAAFAGMVYGATLRTGVYMMQDLFRRLGLGQGSEDIALVRETLAALPQHHFVRAYMAMTPELQHDTALVDTFLHPQDRAYTAPELLEWIGRCGLEFQGWAHNYRYYPEGLVPQPLRQRIAALPEAEQWAAVEPFLCLAGTHAFTCRLEGQARRPRFDGDGWLGYRPRLNPAAALTSEGFRVETLNFAATPAEQVVLAGADGERTIDALIEDPAFSAFERAERQDFARTALERFWKVGAVLLAMPD